MKIDLERNDIDNDGDNLEVDYVAGTCSQNRDTHLEVNLEEGEYYVYCELDWCADETSFVVTTYG